MKANVVKSSGDTVIVYRLIGSNPAFSMIDSLSGEIRTETVIDREQRSYYIYTVEAVANTSPSKTGYVTVSIAQGLRLRYNRGFRNLIH